MLYMRPLLFFILHPDDSLEYCLKENGIENGDTLISVIYIFYFFAEKNNF